MKQDGYKINKSKNKAKTRTNVYIATTIYVKGKNPRTKNLLNIGIEEELIKTHSDLNKYYEEQINKFKEEHGKPIEEIIVKFKSNKDIQKDSRYMEDFGDIFVKRIFDDIELNDTCKEIEKKYKFQYPLYNALLFHVASRITRPGSKLDMYEKSKKTSIIDYKLGRNDVYRAMDVLYDNKAEIFKKCFEKTPKNIKRTNQVMIYDMTDTYFEINYEDDLRRRGKGKRDEKEPLIKLGLVTDEKGYPIDFTVIPGSNNECPSLIPLEEEIINNFSPKELIMVTDAGLCSKENKAFNDTTSRRYVTVNPVRKMGAASLKKYIFDVKNPRKTKDTKYNTPQKIWEKYNENLAIIDSFVENCEQKDNLIKENEYLKGIILSRRYNIADQVKPVKYRSAKDDRFICEAYFVTFNLRYALRERTKRNQKILKVKKLIGRVKDPYKPTNYEDFRYYITQTQITKEGEIVEYDNAINYKLIAEQESLDGYYCISSNYGFNKKLNHLPEDEIEKIEEKENEIVLQVMKNRWVIEDCFRLLKQEFNFHPVNHSLEERIKAHFMTCVMSLLCFKYIKNILKESGESIFEDITDSKLIDLLRRMKILHIVNENLYTPCSSDNEIVKACEIFNIPILKEGLSSGQIQKIIKMKF